MNCNHLDFKELLGSFFGEEKISFLRFAAFEYLYRATWLRSRCGEERGMLFLKNNGKGVT